MTTLKTLRVIHPFSALGILLQKPPDTSLVTLNRIQNYFNTFNMTKTIMIFIVQKWIELK